MRTETQRRPARHLTLGSSGTGQGSTRNLARSLSRVEEQLSVESPELHISAIHQEVDQIAQILLETVRFTDFIPLLTYRLARDRLMSAENRTLRTAA